MARRSKRPRRTTGRADRTDKFIGIVWGGLGVVILITLGLSWWWVQSNRIEYDKISNCPLSGPQSVHAILIDQSDPISPQQAELVKQHFQRMTKKAAFAERFDVYTIDANSTDLLSPVLTVCSPGKGSQANRLYENPERIQKRFEEQFESVISKAVDRLLLPSVRDVSPILESIKAASITSFGPYEPGDVRMNMTIVSDLIQHSASYSHYREQGEFEVLGARSVWRTLQANLKGSDVYLLYILRPAAHNKLPIQNRGHQLFWEKAISANNGLVVEVSPI